ncbi:precorrin-3B synthase [Nocardioides cavernaquae]|uniref:Precorrin-3B synthase n=1 Tax=Nocardioides cavernaquae TaxID=2321396 RepID=A0A3A5HBY4_9ACTN|nr:precorrin-3B synthase [Nocardioides cavernaquae]
MSIVIPSPDRPSSDDSCPGAVRLHAADDGYVARVRIPGGRVSPAQLVALADLAESAGDGHLYLTSRGNVQLRGLGSGCGQDVADALYAAGLLPSVSHDRVRNVVASPLSGVVGPDIESLLSELDAALLEDEALVALSGRFLFGIDNGTGDVLALKPDVAVIVEAGDTVRLAIAGQPTAVAAPTDLAVDLLIGAAHRFLALRAEHGPTAWRVSDLPDAALVELAPGRPGPTLGAPDLTSGHTNLDLSAGEAAGLGNHGSTVVAGVLLGSAPAEAWRAIAALVPADAAGAIRLTPWRSVVLIGPTPDAIDVLASHGFLLDDADPLAPVTACIGRPGCGKALADVRTDALTLATDPTLATPGARLHVSGCDRRCGHPTGPHLSAVATGDGYQIQEL